MNTRFVTRLSALLAAVLSVGCGTIIPLELSPPGSPRWSDFNQFEVVNYRKLGIAVELPRQRFKERIQYNVQFKFMGPNLVSMALHQIGNGPLVETSEKIVIIFEVFSEQEFREYLNKERSCLSYPEDGYESKRLFLARFVQKRDELGVHYRHDHRGPDGTVVIASALNRVDRVKQDADDEKVDVAAIRRILGSVKFIPKKN